MKHKGMLFTSALLGSGLFVLSGQQPDPPAVFTSAQAEAGRIACENSCGQCHTITLLGRKGDPRELPPLSSISESYQKFIGPRGTVPPLAGPVFISRWGGRTAGQLISRFQETVDSFGLEEDKETTVNITAYVLQVNGAKPGNRALTRTTDVVVNSAIRR
jgi:hypothetical protein